MTDQSSRLHELLKGKSASWRWIRKPDNTRSSWISVAFTSDGVTLSHSEDATNEEVMTWVIAVCEARAAKRKASAAKATVTRQRNHKLKLKYVANLYKQGILTPSNRCRICGKAVDDEYSKRRGVGPDCWGRLMDYIAEIDRESQEKLTISCTEGKTSK